MLVQPISASWIHEELARKNKGKVLRSKTFPRHFQEKIREMCNSICSMENDGGYMPANFMQIDAVTALLKLLESLARGGKSLSTFIKEIPGINMRQKEIPCPWGQKGRVMRRLIQEGPGSAERVEMIDGLNLLSGWLGACSPRPGETLLSNIRRGFYRRNCGVPNRSFRRES